MRSLRVSGALILVGYLAVIAGYIDLIIVGSQGGTRGFQIAEAVAYGLVGFGSWRSVKACQDGDASAKLVRGLTRWVGAASGAMAIAFALETYEYHKTFSALVAVRVPIPHYLQQIFFGLAITVGFLLAAFGFWFASSRLGIATEPAQTAVPDS
jgi:hypothetical protein